MLGVVDWYRVESPVACMGAGALLAGRLSLSADTVLASRPADGADFWRFAGGCSASDACEGWDDS